MWYKILNPFFIFCIIWSSVLYLLNLKLTKNIEHFPIEGMSIIIVNIFTSLLIYLFFYFFLSRSTNSALLINITDTKLDISLKFANRFFKLFLFLVIIDIIFSGGVPLFWLFTNSNKDYTNLGIPSIRGFQNTLYLFCSSLYSINLVFRKFKNYKIIIFILGLIPILMLSRSLLMYNLIQLFCINLFFKKATLKQARNIIIFSIIIILLFGFIGDIRGEYANPFEPLISEAIINNPLLKLPSGFTWIYIYITANFNNILLTINTFEPTYEFSNIFYNLTPGFIKSYFFTNQESSPLITDQSLNVASFYAAYVSSFGSIGAIFGGIILQIVSTYYYFKAKTFNIGYLISYSILFTCLVISVFFDSFLTVSTFAQLFLCSILARKLSKISN